MSDQYGILGLSPRERIANIENQLENLIANGARTPAQKGQVAKLMAVRDALLVKAGARKGAALAAGSIPGLAGGLASSGIRGMDVVEHEFTPEVIRQHNLDGAAQGLRQTSVAPPGSGRLINIAFTVSGTVVPVTVVTAGSSAVGSTTSLVTTSVNWAILRIVGLVTQYTIASGQAFGLMQDFKIGGSPNLFLYESWVSMDDYDTDKEQFAGLRAYPVLIAPNTASLDIAAFGVAATPAVACVISVVTEVLRDDAFGPGLPAAYAR